jgi:hypothetical protein
VPGYSLEIADDLPHIRTSRDAGPPADGTRAKDDPGKLFRAEALLDQALRNPCLGLPQALAVGVKTLDDLCRESGGK